MINRQTQHTLAAIVLLGAGAVVLTGCRGDREDAPPRQFFPDLDDQLKWKPQTKSDFFADGRTMRKPVPGTVAFGRVAWVSGEEWAQPFMGERTEFVKGDRKVYDGIGEDGKYLDKIPVPVTMAMLEHGQEKFNIYCSVCHGYQGDGTGRVSAATQQWTVPVANFHLDKYKKPDPKDPTSEFHKDGYIFHTARYGLPAGAEGQPPRMPGYAHALSEMDAWSVVAYIRALQASREGTIEDVPEAMRPKLQSERGAAPSAGGGK